MVADVAGQVVAPARRPAVSAGIPILPAKITVPGVPDWVVPRPRITKLIAEGMRRCPLTIVTGPPGAGKTMALALWAAAEPGTVAWISLDGFDNQPGAFWSYAVAALGRSGVALPEVLSAASRRRAAGHMFLLQLASVLAAQNPPVSLVVDDLHVLTKPTVLTELDFALRNAQPGLRMVISSRVDPLLPLHRYRLVGELTEIRASDLAFSIAEARLLLARHGSSLSAGSLERLMRRTEGWAAGLRLAAISMNGHPDPDQFVKELITEDSALTGYLVEEVLKGASPEFREVLLSTSILEHVNTEAASELTGNEQAGAILSTVARANAFVQPTGCGWYRYHTLFAEVLRLALRREYPDRIAALHRRAARWYERSSMLTAAVQHATQAGDWQLAATMVIDALAISEIIEPRSSPSLAGEFRRMPRGEAWAGPQPYLVAAAIELADGRYDFSAAALDAGEGMLAPLPADEEAACRLAAAVIRVTTSRRTGDLVAAAAAVSDAEALVGRMPEDKLAQHPEVRARVLADRGAVELWPGHLDEATRFFDAGVVAATGPGREHERAVCLGHLALMEAWRGQLRHAAKLAGQAAAALAAQEQRPPPQQQGPAGLAALAWVHLERDELQEVGRLLKQLDAALNVSPDKLIGAVACLVAACGGLAEGHGEAAAQMVARARSGWSVPAWLDRRLSLVESRAYVAVGDTPAAAAAAERAGGDSSPEAAATLAHAWLAAGDGKNARLVLASALPARSGEPERVRVQAWLADARLNYYSGDRARGRRSLVHALRLAEREQLRLPFALEQGWIGPVLRRDPELASIHRRLFPSAPRHDQPQGGSGLSPEATVLVVERLTERELEVLRHVSGMLNTAEIASEMCISINTVKAHLKSSYRKLAVTHRGEAVRRARQLELI
jgi:LuxR family transcriptional regulator, maltose regulon positive regulatory protein